MDKYICKVCATIYDPILGDPENGVPPGTPFDKLPKDWVCPICGTPSDKFEILPPDEYEKLIHIH